MTFLAVAWKGTPEATEERAGQLMPSGNIKWGLDADETVFGLYGVPYQPVTVLITHDKIVKASWPGVLSESEIRSEIESLIDSAS